jgi:hypothetical protein
MPSVLNASALTTLTTLKESVGIASSDTSNDNKLERILNRASDWIEDATGRKLKARRYNGGSSTHTNTGVPDEEPIYFSGSLLDKGGDTVFDKEIGQGVFYLPQYPVQSNDALQFVLSVLESRDEDGEIWDSASLVEWRDYIVDRQNGVLRKVGGPFTPGRRNYRVTMAAGYQKGSAQPYVPGTIEELCIEKAKQFLKADPGIQSESIGTWSRSYSAEASQERIDELVSLYKRHTL